MQFPQVPKSRDQEIDEQIAMYTDQILSGEKIERREMNDVEVADLQRTVLRIRAAYRREQPDPLMVARIQNRLQVEWKEVWQERRATRRWPQLVLFGALAVVLVVAVFASGMPADNALPGAADYFPPWAPVIVILGVILIAVLIWIDHRR